MDDKRIQSLLELAGSEYNQGKYAEAIEHWQEILSLDPENQKAREGIRMAKLLVVNWESSQAGGEELMLDTGGVDPETQQKIEFGIARVRELLTSGRHKEAMEGCQLLAELAPGMPSVTQLQEEIAHAIEVQPYIGEHLGRARKLIAAGKGGEAVEEARKVLSVDPGNPEAQGIVSKGRGTAAPGASPSAFDKEGHPAPPSPFAGSSKADEMMASMDLGQHGGGRAGDAAGEESPIEMEFEEVSSHAPSPGAGSDGKVARMLEQGRGLFAQKKYQEAIDVWSRVFTLDESNVEAGNLIDQANARIAEIVSKVEDAMYRAQDQVDAGNLAGAKKVFEEVLSIQPGNREALDRIAKIDEQLSGPDLGEAIPMAASQPGTGAEAAPEAGAGERAGKSQSSEAFRAAPGIRAASPQRAASSSGAAGIFKKKPVVPIPPAGGSGRTAVVSALVVIVLGGAAAGWWFLMGTGAEAPEEIGPPPEASAGLPGATPTTKEPEKPGSAAGPGSAEAGVAPQQKQPAQPADPAAVQKQIASLMREGRDLLGQKQYTEAHSRFKEVLALDVSNFDAEELRLKASAGMAEEARFNKDLESARAAFEDQDWASSLYKLYRLQQEREDMTILKRYIANANHNWGVQDLEAFRLTEALEHFQDALEQLPDDRATQQHINVVQRYEKRRRDPAFDAYIAKLKLRALDAR